MGLLGKVAVITGAASGIKETARAYRREGTKVVIPDLVSAMGFSAPRSRSEVSGTGLAIMTLVAGLS